MMRINNNSTEASGGDGLGISYDEKRGTPNFIAQICNSPNRRVAYDIFDATRISQGQGSLDGISKIFSVNDVAYAGSITEPKTTFVFNGTVATRNVVTKTISKDGHTMAMRIDQFNFGFTVGDIAHWFPLFIGNGLPIPKATSHSVYVCASAKASDEKVQSALQETVASICNDTKVLGHPMITMTSEDLDVSWSEVAATSLPLPLDIIFILFFSALIVHLWEFVFRRIAWH